MQYEVEQKHRLTDPASLMDTLAKRGVTLSPPVEQSDVYFAHPSRDFATTDEALRIRSSGGKCYVTYKGPKLDTVTKTRREIELPLDPSDRSGTRFGELLNALGFRPVATVRKSRRLFHIRQGDCEVEGALDDVAGVGVFVELELQSVDAQLDEARRTIAELAAVLGLGPTERRSYLELLLEQTVPRSN